QLYFTRQSESSCFADGSAMISAYDGRLRYWDLKTNSEVVICPDANCIHETYHPDKNPNPTCTSVTPLGQAYSCVFIFKEKIYYIQSDDINRSEIYVCDKDAKNKKKLLEFDSNVHVLATPIFREGKLFFLANHAVYEDSDTDRFVPKGYDFRIYSFDINSKKLSKIKAFNGCRQLDIRNMHMYDNKLIYEIYTSTVDFSEIYDFEKNIYTDDPDKYASRQIISLDISSGKEEVIFDSLKTFLIDSNNENIYISQNQNEDSSSVNYKVIEYNLKDKTSVDICMSDNDYYSAVVRNGYIIYSDYPKDRICIFSISDKKLITISQDDLDSYEISFVTNSNVVLRNLTNNNIWGVIPFNDFVNGNIENISTIEREDLNNPT
ncbi:MAG: hypothetical protein GX896_09645, partial [Clostridiales bacterium]|nr:hypothetical protein [Clostridiales bacterium]